MDLHLHFHHPDHKIRLEKVATLLKINTSDAIESDIEEKEIDGQKIVEITSRVVSQVAKDIKNGSGEISRALRDSRRRAED